MESKNSALYVVDRLLVNADLVASKGRILYAENWYTILRMTQHLYELYGWLCVGAVVPSDSKDRNENDIPIHLLTVGALANVG